MIDLIKLFFAGLGIFGFIAFVLLTVCFGGICLHYDIHFWASYAKNYDVAIPWIPCILLGWFTSALSVPAAVITWVMSFFI